MGENLEFDVRETSPTFACFEQPSAKAERKRLNAAICRPKRIAILVEQSITLCWSSVPIVNVASVILGKEG